MRHAPDGRATPRAGLASTRCAPGLPEAQAGGANRDGMNRGAQVTECADHRKNSPETQTTGRVDRTRRSPMGRIPRLPGQYARQRTRGFRWLWQRYSVSSGKVDAPVYRKQLHRREPPDGTGTPALVRDGVPPEPIGGDRVFCVSKPPPHGAGWGFAAPMDGAKNSNAPGGLCRRGRLRNCGCLPQPRATSRRLRLSDPALIEKAAVPGLTTACCSLPRAVRCRVLFAAACRSLPRPVRFRVPFAAACRSLPRAVRCFPTFSGRYSPVGIFMPFVAAGLSGGRYPTGGVGEGAP